MAPRAVPAIQAAGLDPKVTASLDCWHDLKSKRAEPRCLDPGAVLLAVR
jgi:hypothetical protein